MNVIKRDGIVVEYDRNKIYNAIEKAYDDCGHDPGYSWAKRVMLTDEIEDNIMSMDYENISVEEIQDAVMEVLKDNEQDVYYAYKNHREERTRQRELKMKMFDNILGLLNKTNEDVMKENSNKNAVIAATQRDLIAGEVSKELSKQKLIPKYIIDAHERGAIHWHDMDYTLSSMFNCCLINLEDMFVNGTVINDKLVEEPKSFSTACTVATQIAAQVASNQYGGQSITIKHLAKYLKVTEQKAFKHYFALNDEHDMRLVYEDIVKLARDTKMKELRDGIQTIRYQLSTLQTTNGQAPFITIYLEVEEGHEYEEEMALICEEMIKQRLEGMKNYKGQEIGEAFPKLVYLLDDHNCLEGGKYDYITKLAAKCTAKRLVPDYQSAKIMRKNYEGNTFPPMGCRSHLSPWKDENDKYKWYGRFNQGVVSLNLPQVALMSNGMDNFWEVFDRRLELCKDALLLRHKMLLGTKSDISPIHWQHGAIARLKQGETIDKCLKNGYSTLSLGYVGICETVYKLMNVSHTTPEGKELALKIMNHMNAAVTRWKKETGLGFGLYGTPAENLIYRFCRLDKKAFGEVKGVTDKLYYTNSYHVHVTEPIDAFSKLKFESEFHNISLGGCISYVEVPDMSKNLEAVEQIINYIYHNIQYAEINTKPDVCYKCSYTGEIELNKEDLTWVCPSCGNKDENEMQVMRRTCGYIGTNFWNKGRTAEIGDRVLHL